MSVAFPSPLLTTWIDRCNIKNRIAEFVDPVLSKSWLINYQETISMSLNKKNSSYANVAQAVRLQQERENTYRERALKLFPWVCGHCGRDFEGKRLRELTVHHKDHNHDNNPPDGSNWELLCIYCHDNEHSRDQVADAYDTLPAGDSSDTDNDFVDNPFAALANRLKER
jgi:hypothetical protein